MSVPDMIQVLGVATIFLLIGGLGLTGIRWLWLRTGRGHTPVSGELADLQARVAELEGERREVAELEERLDFAERLLAQQQKQDQLPRGS